MKTSRFFQVIVVVLLLAVLGVAASASLKLSHLIPASDGPKAPSDRQKAATATTVIRDADPASVLTLATYVGGPRSARYAVVEVAGATCPVCRRLYPFAKRSLDELPVERYWLNMDTHEGSEELGYAALKYAGSPQFPALYDWLFSGKQHTLWTLEASAKDIGIGQASSDAVAAHIFKAQSDEAVKLGVMGTPCFLVLDLDAKTVTRVFPGGTDPSDPMKPVEDLVTR